LKKTVEAMPEPVLIDANQVRAAIAGVLDGVDFGAPVELADVLTVHDAIVARLPAGARLESYHTLAQVVFEARRPVQKGERGSGAVICRFERAVVGTEGSI
jgi:antitoxin (DNA-binding transcriptional repressor) of toxin-antitoxin stability system